MSDERFRFGDDELNTNNMECEVMETPHCAQIVVALDLCGSRYKGWYTDKSISFFYEAEYSDEVREIIKKATTEEYEKYGREIIEHRKAKDYLYFLPAVARHLNMTEGTLRRKPVDHQLAICKCYTDIWFCDSYTIKRMLTAVLVGEPTTYRQTAETK